MGFALLEKMRVHQEETYQSLFELFGELLTHSILTTTKYNIIHINYIY